MGPNRRLMNRRRTNILILGRKGMGGATLLVCIRYACLCLPNMGVGVCDFHRYAYGMHAKFTPVGDHIFSMSDKVIGHALPVCCLLWGVGYWYAYPMNPNRL